MSPKIRLKVSGLPRNASPGHEVSIVVITSIKPTLRRLLQFERVLCGVSKSYFLNH